jgi:hypothetical protein
MAFTTPPPVPKPPPVPPTVWIDLKTGRLTKEAQDFIVALHEYHKRLTQHLTAMAAAIP